MPVTEAYTLHKNSGGGGCRCCRCFLFCCCLLFLIISIQITLFFYFLPKTPQFEVQKISVKSLDFSPVYGITANIKVVAKVTNPNKNIGIIYGPGGSVNIQYSGVNLGDGELPSFRQDESSSTLIDVELKGVSPFRLDLMEALLKQRSYRRIPVTLNLRVPVRLVVETLQLKEVRVIANISLVVDAFSADTKTMIVSSETVYRVELF